MVIAARNILLGKHIKYKRAGKNYDILNDTADQTDLEEGYKAYPNFVLALWTDTTQEALRAETQRVLTSPYGPEWAEEPFFYAPYKSSMKINQLTVGFTRNSPTATANYRPYLRFSFVDETGAGLAAANTAGGGGAGMTQFGALAESARGATYKAILSRFYHPLPPYVTRVVMKQDSAVIYDRSWTDRFEDVNAPRRELAGPAKMLTSKAAPLAVEIFYSESMQDTAARPLTLHVGSEKVPLGRVGGTDNRKAGGTLTVDQLARLGDGGHALTLAGYHLYVEDWELDSTPATVWRHDLAGTTGNDGWYERGADTHHVLRIDTTPPAAVSNLAADTGTATEGLTLTWTAPADPDLSGYLVFRREESASGPTPCSGPSRVIGGVLFCAVLDPDDPDRGAPLVLTADASTWTDPGTRAGMLYTYALVAVDLAGNESTAVVVEGNLPLTVALVLDRSGSMAWPSGSGRSRIEVAQAAAGLFLDILGAKNSDRTSADQQHKAAVVSFGSDVVDEAQGLRLYEGPRAVTGAEQFGKVLENIATVVGTVPAWTNVTGGLERAWLAFDSDLDGVFDDPARAHKVLLLTDGEHNHKRGRTDFYHQTGINDPLYFVVGQGRFATEG